MTNPAQPLRAARLILLALAAGVLIFACVASWLRATGAMPSETEIGGLLALIAAGIGVMQLPVYFVLRANLLGRARGQKEESLELLQQDRIPPPLMTLAIVGAALAEGMGLFGTVALLLGAPWIALALPALSIVLILAQIPTRERMERALRGG
jgi:hypothetical protein